jgi:predicted homoserine dehydrogenase-like protein
VWEYYGLSQQRAARAGMNPKMFNSFLDGTKSSIEMAAVANATGLAPPADGLLFPPCDVRDLPQVLKPRDSGGVLAKSGTVEVVSSLQRDGQAIEQDLRWGVYVTFEAPSDYVRDCFAEYGLLIDESGRYSALYRPHHLIGLELGISVASAALRSEATGAPRQFEADVIATAKRTLNPGEKLDGEGGYTVWGKLTTAEDSLAMGAIPIGLANDLRLSRSKSVGEPILWDDVDVEQESVALQTRRELENSMLEPPPLTAPGG